MPLSNDTRRHIHVLIQNQIGLIATFQQDHQKKHPDLRPNPLTAETTQALANLEQGLYSLVEAYYRKQA